mgnify:CR=1
MGIFDGRLDLLLIFIAQVVQIILYILVLTRMAQHHESRSEHATVATQRFSAHKSKSKRKK